MKKILAILLSVVMLLGCVVISTAADENDAPTFHPVSATEPTVLNIIEKGAWSENNLEAEQHKVPLNVLEDSVHDFRFGDTATFNINVAKAGTYTLALTHIWAAPSNWTISIDDAEAIPVEISATPPDWVTAGDAALGAYELTAGDHTITLTCAQEDSGQHIYSLTVTPPKFEVEVAVDTQGATENHGLTITNGVGPLGLSYQFKTNAAFKAFAPKLGMFAANRIIDISITKRGSEEPIQTWTVTGDDVTGDNSVYWNDVANNGAWVTCELDEELPAGEYIVSVAPNVDLPTDVVWKKFDVKDELGLWESVGSFDGERETARNSTPAFKVTFTEELEDGAYFAKAGEPNVVAVDNQGAEVGHGLTITNNVGGVSVSYQFKTTAAFEEFSIMFGFFSADKNINVTIYDLNDELIQTWNPSGNEGVEATDSTGVWTAFELDEVLPAGEYIIVVDPTADTSDTRDVIWKRYDVVDANGIFHSTFEAEDEWAVKATPCLTFTFTEFAEDDAYFAKAGETPVEPPVDDETTAPESEETTAPESEETTAPESEETTAPETTAPETTAPETTVADTTVADTTAAATTAAGTEAGTAAGTGATGTKAPATTTAAAASEGCKAVVGSMSAIALVAIASAAAVVLKKKED